MAMVRIRAAHDVQTASGVGFVQQKDVDGLLPEVLHDLPGKQDLNQILAEALVIGQSESNHTLLIHIKGTSDRASPLSPPLDLLLDGHKTNNICCF